jgi:hypothetical protein
MDLVEEKARLDSLRRESDLRQRVITSKVKYLFALL